MKQRPLLRHRRGIFHNQRAGRECGRQIDFAQRACGDDARAGGGRPDGRQMRLAGALRPDQRDGARRPIRPGIDRSERLLIGGSRQKILARETFGVFERERELARGNGRDAYDGRPPV